MAKLTPATNAAGQALPRPRRPPTTQARYAGRIRDRNGSWRPTIAESFITSRPVTPASATMGTPMLPNGDGRGVRDEADEHRQARLETEADEQEGRNRHRRAEARAALEQRAEAEGHQNRLHRPVAGRAALHPAAQLPERAGLGREVVEPEAVEDGPEDRPERERPAVGQRQSGERRRHAPDADREEQGDGQPAGRGERGRSSAARPSGRGRRRAGSRRRAPTARPSGPARAVAARAEGRGRW